MTVGADDEDIDIQSVYEFRYDALDLGTFAMQFQDTFVLRRYRQQQDETGAARIPWS